MQRLLRSLFSYPSHIFSLPFGRRRQRWGYGRRQRRNRYDFGGRWIQEHQDYSRLKQRCRQKFLQQGVTKTLVIKGTLALLDMTDEVELIGSSPVGYGSFSDVWKGWWKDRVEKREKMVRWISTARDAKNINID